MRISEITGRLGLTVYSPGDPAREIGGVISGDLLSFIMAEKSELNLMDKVKFLKLLICLRESKEHYQHQNQHMPLKQQ